jgi:hypothetical protein
MRRLLVIIIQVHFALALLVLYPQVLAIAAVGAGALALAHRAVNRRPKVEAPVEQVTAEGRVY